jgi:acetolactate synthase, large subunit, biosynthetic type
MKLTGAEIVIECLKEQGVDTVFGYPGGAILNIYDALYKHSDEIKHILTAHEQGASHAADGYSRASGKIGVCFATSGPGATNLVTGIATAYMDSIPMVAVTCNVGKNLLGKDSFQEIDITGVTMPITKHNYIIKDIADLADTIRKAFTIAQTGRPGPVLVDIPKDITATTYEYKKQVPKAIVRDVENIKDKDIETVIELIKKSEKPFVFLGGGVILSDAYNEVVEFVDKIHAPVADTLMGKGAFDGTSELYTGMVGMHGTKTSNLGFTKSDLIIVIGARFSDRVTGNANKFAKNAKIVQIDVDPTEINKNILTYASINGDIKEILKILNSKLTKQNHDKWIEHIKELKEKFPLKYDKNILTGPYIIEQIYNVAPDAIISTEVGQHQMWAAQFYKYTKPRTFMTSGGLGTMGYGLGASLGAKCAMPNKTVVNIAGDGCFRMNMNELCTASRYNIPIVQVILNNHVLGMVRQWQNLFYGQRYSETVLDDVVDFVKLAEAMGIKAYRVTKKEEFVPIFKEAVESGKPALIDCQIAADDKVFPMVAPGGAIEDVFEEEDLANC